MGAVVKAKPRWSDNDIYVCLVKHGLAWGRCFDKPHSQMMDGAQAANAMLELRNYYESLISDQYRQHLQRSQDET
jgi:hypothetical protein